MSTGMEKLFAAMDLDKTNYVSKKNIEDSFEMLGAPASMISQAVEDLMKRDADKDGKLSKQEFCSEAYTPPAGKSVEWLYGAIESNFAKQKKLEELRKGLESKKGVEFFKALLGDKVLSGKEEKNIEDALNGVDYVAVYLSAHWCPPCRRFTPAFAKIYKEMQEMKEGKKLACVFVSCDRDQQAFDGYFGEMPWLAVPFGNKKFVGFESAAAAYLGCEGIPQLGLFDATGKLIKANARGLVMSKKKKFLESL